MDQKILTDAAEHPEKYPQLIENLCRSFNKLNRYQQVEDVAITLQNQIYIRIKNATSSLLIQM